MRSTNLPKNTEIVVYCGGPKCPQSRMAAEKLIKLGYENVRAYEGGLEEWKGAGFAVEKAWRTSSKEAPAGPSYLLNLRDSAVWRTS